MPIKIVVRGKISKEEQLFNASNDSISLLDFLRAKSIPVASSCYGEGVCKKCSLTLNGSKIISCQINIQGLTKKTNEIIIDYI